MGWRLAACRYAAALALLWSVLALSPVAARAQLFDAFSPGPNDQVLTLAPRQDGKILAGGRFTNIAGLPRNRIALLNEDGSAVTSFNPNANNWVHSVAVQPGGKILVGGDFTSIATQPRSRIARLNADGSLDTSFNPGANGTVQSLVPLPDNKILVGGGFSTISGATRPGVARLNEDGSLDPSFAPGVAGKLLAVQGDGKVLVAGGGGVSRLNVDGTVDGSFVSPAVGDIRAGVIQADGKILIGGDFGTVGTESRNHIARLNPNGTLDASFIPELDTTGFVSALAVQADGKILAGGIFGSAGQPGNNLTRLNADGTSDPSWTLWVGNFLAAIVVQEDGKILIGGGSGILRRITPGTADTSFTPEADNWVVSLASQPDGKLLVGGFFSGIAGQTRNRIARLNPDGSADQSFDPNVNGTLDDDFVGGVLSIALQTDGKILIGGTFTSVGGVARKGIVRLNAGGTLDASFNPNVNYEVDPIVVLADGKILIGGGFTSVGGQQRNHIALLNAGGTLDATFDPDVNGYVNALVPLPSGKILIGGDFTSVGGEPRSRLARLNSDGSLDDSFNTDANGFVGTMALQPDGKILVGGQFTSVGGLPRNNLARLGADGAVDTDFNPDANGTVWTVALGSDGNILIGGEFTAVGGRTRYRAARLSVGGTLQPAFSRDADGTVYALLLQADGKILAGGSFFSIGGRALSRVARLNNDTAASSQFSVSPATLTWSRGGASPDFSRVTFEQSSDGVNFSFLGEGQRVGASSSWQLTGQALTPVQDIHLRARGHHTGALFNGSGSITESLAILPPPPFNLNYSANPAQYTVGTEIVPNAPSSGGGPVASYSISQALPAGLQFNTSTGVVSGTPAAASPQTIYTVTATNQGGAANVELIITVVQPALRIDSVAPAAGRTEGGQQINLMGEFAGLSAVKVGGVSAAWSFTSGGDTSEITVTTPPHDAGAVGIELVLQSGGTYFKPTSFAYLPTSFTDNVLVAGITAAKAQHVLELRQAVDALRAISGLSSAPWADATLSPTSTLIKAIHIVELRTYLDDAATRLGYATTPYTDPALSAGQPIKRVHIEELRQRVRSIAG